MSECNGAGFLIDGGGIVGECAGCQKCQPKDAEIARLTKERDSAIARAERAEAALERIVSRFDLLGVSNEFAEEALTIASAALSTAEGKKERP